MARELDPLIFRGFEECGRPRGGGCLGDGWRLGLGSEFISGALMESGAVQIHVCAHGGYLREAARAVSLLLTVRHGQHQARSFWTVL
jgi:hypothetical protein